MENYKANEMFGFDLRDMRSFIEMCRIVAYLRSCAIKDYTYEFLYMDEYPKEFVDTVTFKESLDGNVSILNFKLGNMYILMTDDKGNVIGELSMTSMGCTVHDLCSGLGSGFFMGNER